MFGAGQAGGEGGAVGGAAAAGVVLVQVVGQGVPATANAHHDVGAQDLWKEIMKFNILKINLKVQSNRFRKIEKVAPVSDFG